MKPLIDTLSRHTIVDFIGSIFDRRGNEEYLGEPVNMGQHMLQGATIAEQDGQSEEIIIGALLHDIGHFTSEFGTFTMNDTEDRHHEDAGAEVLERFFQRLSLIVYAITWQPNVIFAKPDRNTFNSCPKHQSTH